MDTGSCEPVAVFGSAECRWTEGPRARRRKAWLKAESQVWCAVSEEPNAYAVHRKAYARGTEAEGCSREP
ncbi:hypothetical protein [Paenibacillus chitinolyticus]|uniref:hypothetical protein n=1 Tax=Paenibacillus chitinolyticus TaxID=79263 RepID=UPI00366E3A29